MDFLVGFFFFFLVGWLALGFFVCFFVGVSGFFVCFFLLLGFFVLFCFCFFTGSNQ